MLVREWLAQLGVTDPVISSLQERYSPNRILRQLEWLRDRNPRDPAAMLVRAIQEDWDPPPQVAARESAGGDGRDTVQPLAAPMEANLQRGQSYADAVAPLQGGEEEDGFAPEELPVDIRDAWVQLLAEIRLQMTRVTFDTWLGGTEVAGVHGDVVSVLVRDGYAAEWLQARWKQPIERTLSGIVGRPVSVRFLGPAVER